MEITEYIKQTGAFLNAEDVEEVQPCVFIITAEAELIENKFGKNRLHIPGELREAPKVFDCGKTNARKIAEVLKDDTSKWIGKKLILDTYKMQTSSGKMVNAINIKEVQ